MKKKIILITSLIALTILVGIITLIVEKKQGKIDKSSKDTTSVIDMTINTDDDNEKIDWSQYKSESYKLTKSLKITEGGTYNLTGTISNGLITIDTTSDVKIILNNVKIKNQTGPAIYVKNSQNTIIELKENSKNYLEDGKEYKDYEDEVVGVIYSHDDITFEGLGTLEVVSNNSDAIVGKDDLKIISGTYIINSKDDGIRGKDSVYIKDGNFSITSKGDGIKSTNTTDKEKGFILIENGTFNISSVLDAISSESKISIKDGTFNITTGEKNNNLFENDIQGSKNEKNTSNKSAKGIKAADSFLLENGILNLNTLDDAIHCNNYVGIKNGKLNITSNDDAIHADKEIIIDSGDININKSYEGLEAAKITINGANINVISSDDGINIAGGNDNSAMNRPGENNYNQNTDNILTINNGNIYINAKGDGIDINGIGYINGGTLKIDGPENNGNGTLDYDSDLLVNGGEVIAGGSSGMLQTFSEKSQLYSVTIIFKNSYNEKDTITITDESKNIIATYNSKKSYNSLIIASDKIQKNKEYTININNSKYETFKVSNKNTIIGNITNQKGPGENQHNPPPPRPR